MPSGVEHSISSAGMPAPKRRVVVVVMPSGVEHITTADEPADEETVVVVVMPSGVEHMTAAVSKPPTFGSSSS